MTALTHCWGSNINVYLLAGQSNALGAFTGEYSAEYDTEPANVQFYNNGNLSTLIPDSTAPYYFGDGLELELGRQMVLHEPGADFAILKHAGAGQSLYDQSDWYADGTSSSVNDGTAYLNFQNSTARALTDLSDRGYTTQLRGFIWVQGEADAAEGRSTEEYTADLTNFIVDVRSTYGDIPFIFTRLSDNAVILDAATKSMNRVGVIQAAQDSVDASVEGTYLIHSNSFELIGDNVHYSASGQITHGATVYNTLQSIPEPSSMILLLGSSAFLVAQRKRRP